MPAQQPPADVQRLLEERAEARRSRDWPRADALRDELAALGWEPQDGPRGSTARPILAEPVPDAGAVSFLDDPVSVVASVQIVADDHPDDLARCVGGLAAHAPAVDWELVIVADGPAFAIDPVLQAAALPIEPVIVHSEERLGWGGSRTLGLRHSRGEITILLDTSVEPVGDFVTPLLGAFDADSASVSRVGGASRAPTVGSSSTRRPERSTRSRATASPSGARH